MRLCEPLLSEESAPLDGAADTTLGDDELRVNNDWRIEVVGRLAARRMRWPDRPLGDFEGRRLWELSPRLVGTTAETKLREAMRERRTVRVEWTAAGHAALAIHSRPVPHACQLQVQEIPVDAAPPPPHPSPTPRLDPPTPDALLAASLTLNPLPAYLCSALGRFTAANEPAAAFLGWSPEDLNGRTFLDLVLPASVASALQSALQQSILAGAPERIALQHPQPDGTVVCYEHRFTPLHQPDGTVLRVIGIAQPVAPPAAITDTLEADTLRHRALGEIAAALLRGLSRRSPLPKLLRQMAEAVGAEIHLLHTVAPDRSRLSFEASGGLEQDQVAKIASPGFGEGLSGITAREDWPIVLDSVPSHPHPAAHEPREWGARAAACHPLRSGGQLLGTLTFATTTRDRFSAGELTFIRDAAHLLAGALEIRQLLEDTQSAQAAAASDLRTKDEFIAAVSHELRTPLNPALLIASHAACNPNLPSAARAEFESIVNSIRMEVRLIDDLLDLTRFNHGKLSLETKPLLLHSVLMSALTTVNAEIDQKRIELTLALLPTSPTVNADPLRLQQVLWNLLKNAVKFTPTGGVVSVRTRLSSNGHARVEIMDTGVGLTAEEIAHAFDSFAQGEHARQGTSPFGGLGLGLSIARKIVDLHSGRIFVNSDGRDRGACFVVELPVVSVTPALPPDASPPTPPEPAPPAPRAGLRILLVEDHRATREALLRLLVQRDHEVIGAGSVSEARHIALKKEFDLVISDVGLPDLSGYELMSGLRSDYKLQGIALTGHGTEDDIARAQAAGFVAHIVKPITIQALEAALAQAAPTPPRTAK